MLSTRSSKCSSPCTRMRVYTWHRHDLLNHPYRHFTPASSTRDTRTHRFLDVCFLVVAGRILHCAQFLPSHPPTSTAAPLFPSRHHPRSRTLMQRAMQPPRRRLLLFPFFQFGWGAGSERATHSLIPFYFLAAYAPTLQTVSIHPLTCTPFSGGQPKEKYLYLSVSSRATSPLLVPTSVLPPLRNTILRHHLRDSLCLTYFLFLYRFFCASFSFLLPSTTSYRDAARPRGGRRERGLDKTDGDRS